MPTLPRLALASALLVLAPACGVLTPACLPGPGQPAPGVIVGGQVRLPVALAEAGATAAYAREVAVSGGEVFLSDAAGRALPGVMVKTTEAGGYQMNRVPPGQSLVIAVRAKTASGQPVELRGLLRTTDQGATVPVNAATTIATMALLEGQRGAVGDFDQKSYDRLVAKVYEKLAGVTSLDLRDEAAVIALFKTWLPADAELQGLFDRLRAEVTKPALTLEQQIAAIQALQGLPAAGALPARPPATPSAGPSFPFSSPSPSGSATPVPADFEVMTVAGAGEGFADGTGAEARLESPGGLAFDPTASTPTLYVADTGNNRIRKLVFADPDAPVVTTVAGTGQEGTQDGPGESARFSEPFGLAFDTDGTLLVSDSKSGRVRRIDVHAADARVTTAFAPSGSARFQTPMGLAVDHASGALYVSDYADHTVRRVAPDAGTAAPARFITADPATPSGVSAPMGVLYDDDNHFLWLADSGKGLIRTVAADGRVTTFAGREDSPSNGYAEGIGTEARFRRPSGLARHTDGWLVVADAGNHRIRRVDVDGRTSLIAGGVQGSADGRRADASFNGPTWVAVGPDGRIYVSDTGNHRIRRITVS